MDIFIRTETGNTFMYVERSCTVGDLKLQIQQSKGIPVHQQLLTLWLMGKQLDRDDLYLADYNIHNGSNIHLRIIAKTNPSQITIKTVEQTETTYTLNVTADDTIKNIKQKIFEKTKIAIDHQILSWNRIPLCDELTLSAALIPDLAILDLKLRFKQVNISIVLPNDEQFKLSINQSKTVKDLKEKVEGKYGIPKQDQIYNEIDMQNLNDGQELKLTIPICETYENNIYSKYINVAEKMSKELNEKFISEISNINVILADAKNYIKIASSLNQLRNIKGKISSRLEFEGHKYLKLFKSEIAKLKKDSVSFHSKQVIKCNERNDYMKHILCKLKDEMSKTVPTKEEEIKCNEYNELKTRIESLEKFCGKNYYKLLCNFISNKNMKILNEKVAGIEKLYHETLQKLQHQEEFKRALIDKMKELESNFHLWDVEMSVEWLLLIEFGYFDYKQYEIFIRKIKQIGINGKQLCDLNNKLVLNMIGLKQKQHQYILRKHINRIIKQYENDNDQSMCGLCIENPINTVIIPCGHQYHCANCIANYEPDSCPICRKAINQIIRTFLSGFSK